MQPSAMTSRSTESVVFTSDQRRPPDRSSSPLPPVRTTGQRMSIVTSVNNTSFLTDYPKPATPYEDKVVPTLRNRNRSEPSTSRGPSTNHGDINGKQGKDDLENMSRVTSTIPTEDAIAELNQAEMIEANQMMSVFDQRLVRYDNLSRFQIIRAYE
jgi:hypothetical protein